MDEIKGVVTRAGERPREAFEDPARGDVSWFTLISGDITPTNRLSAGVAEVVASQGRLALHRHEQAELYYILEGSGILTVDGAERHVAAGDAVFISENAEHGLRNESETLLRLLYVFPTDRFSDVVYRFSEAGAPA